MTTENEGNVHFKALNRAEKISKISQACKLPSLKATIWVKGETKYEVSFQNFFQEQEEILIEGHIIDSIIGKDVLYSFDLNGLKLFGKGKLTTQTGNNVYLNFSGDLFKSERRINFRLLTYPHQEVYLHLPIETVSDEKGNLINLKTGISETGIFENFLEFIQQENEEESQIPNHLKIRVLDISVTGAALLLSEQEHDLLSKYENKFEKIILDFNGDLIEIPGCTILYSLDYEVQGKNVTYKKSGMKFENLDINLDEKLSSIINKTLRTLESEFEDFLK